MQASKRAATIGTGIGSVVAKYGDEIWELICDEFPCDRPFSTAAAGQMLKIKFGKWSERYEREIARAVLLTVEDQGHGVVRRHGHSWII